MLLVIIVFIEGDLRDKINNIFYDKDSKNIFLYALVNNDVLQILTMKTL